MASRFNDDGVTALYQAIAARSWPSTGLKLEPGKLPPVARASSSSGKHAIVPPARARYLAEIADTVRGYHSTRGEQVQARARAPAAAAKPRRMLAAGRQPRPPTSRRR